MKRCPQSQGGPTLWQQHRLSWRAVQEERAIQGRRLWANPLSLIGPGPSAGSSRRDARRPQRPPMSRAAALLAVRTQHDDGFDPVAQLVVISELEARVADRAGRGVT